MTKKIGRTGFVVEEVQGIGIANVEAVIKMPEPLFIALVTMYAQAAYDSTPVADIFNELRALGEKYGDKAFGERMVRIAEGALKAVWPPRRGFDTP